MKFLLVESETCVILYSNPFWFFNADISANLKCLYVSGASLGSIFQENPMISEQGGTEKESKGDYLRMEKKRVEVREMEEREVWQSDKWNQERLKRCLLYTSDAVDEL